MQTIEFVRRTLLIFFLIMLSGCGSSPNVQVNELSNSIISYDETVRINNCGGKADSEQTKSRSFSTNIEGGIDVGVQHVVEGVISSKYSHSRNVSVSQKLVAPAGTNMEFVLRWSEEVHAGNVIVNGSTGTYKANIPVAVEQVASQDLGCSGSVQIPAPVIQPTINSDSSIPTKSIAVQLPSGISCQSHNSGYCGIVVSVSWTNIDPKGGYFIYAIGHGLYYQPEMWWIAGNGFPVSTSNGSQVITDGAYGNSGDSLGVFVCLTKTRYSFDGKKEILFYEKPSCEMYSQELYFQPK